MDILTGGVAAWKQAGFPVATIAQMTPGELMLQLKSNEMQVLDVRREPEWDAGHIESANGGRWIISAFLRRRLITMRPLRFTAKVDTAA